MQLTNLLTACALIAPALGSDLRHKPHYSQNRHTDDGLVLYDGNWGYWITEYANNGAYTHFRTASKTCKKYSQTSSAGAAYMTVNAYTTSKYTVPSTTLYSTAGEHSHPRSYGHGHSHTIPESYGYSNSHTIPQSYGYGHSQSSSASRSTVWMTVTKESTRLYTVPASSYGYATPPAYSHTHIPVYSPPSYGSSSSAVVSSYQSPTPSSSAYIPVYPVSSSSSKCTKTKTTSPPAYVSSTTSAPSVKTTVIYVTKPCPACSESSSTVHTKTLSATSCVTIPATYVTKTHYTTTTVKPSTATPYVSTKTSCKTYTVPPTTSWVWPGKYTTHMASPPAYATSVGVKCPTHSKTCHHARDLEEYTETTTLCSSTEPVSTEPASTTSCPPSSTSAPPTSSSSPCPSSSTEESSTPISTSTPPTPTPYVSTVTTCSTYTSGTSTWTSDIVTSSVVTPSSTPLRIWSPSVYMPTPSKNGTWTPSMTPAVPVNAAAAPAVNGMTVALVALVVPALFI